MILKPPVLLILPALFSPLLSPFLVVLAFFFSSRRRHTIYIGDWSSDVCSSDLEPHRLASFIVGGQIRGEPMRLFRIYAEGNFIEAGTDTPFFQTGEAKYGKPIMDRVKIGRASGREKMKMVEREGV